MDTQTVNIRSIQHFMYCPRRYGLLEVNDDWAENAFVVMANIMHENVHNAKHSFTSQNKIVVSAIDVYNDKPEYNLFGVCDCIEFNRCNNGVFIEKLGGNFDVKIVEYKPNPPKDKEYYESDAMQVFAQKLCVDYIYGCDCDCCLYYTKTKKRVALPFKSEFDRWNEQLLKYLIQMREVLATQRIPQKRKGQKCSGCSLKDYCFPKSANASVKDEIMELMSEV
ncbi:MAG: Dna2/Cas4 domain-containing protein [Ruminococcus sp.]|nr:Dna2/Cas4 domain-containing protein [Ruminococcus sp.]